MLTPEQIEALARKHGATSYRNRADTQHPAYGFSEAGLQALIAEAQAATLATVTPLVQEMLTLKAQFEQDLVAAVTNGTTPNRLIAEQYDNAAAKLSAFLSGATNSCTLQEMNKINDLGATKESNHGTHEN